MKTIFTKSVTTLAVATLLLSACSNQAGAQNATYTTQAQRGTPMRIDFNAPETTQPWWAVNDGVMGGRSSGGPRFSDGAMVFEGTINTNGGGFSSVRTEVSDGALAQTDALRLRVKSDGRGYKMSFRTDARKGWREVSFQAPIPTTPAGEWAEVTVPFSALSASIFGRPVRDVTFEKSNIREIGIILADGKDGPFLLSVDWIVAE